MPTLTQIQEPIRCELERYDEFLVRNFRSESRYASAVMEYIFNTRGKQLRPLIVLLSAALNGSISERSYEAAMFVEMIHTASLVHDDVVDEADLRRGHPAVHTLWGSHTAVLMGDYLFAKSYSLCMERGATDIVSLVTRAIGLVCEGELDQTEQAERLEMTRQIYFDIIYKKTASLICAAATAGALSAGASDTAMAQMKLYGDNLGIAFQIKDDILDYTPNAKTGKRSCNDLRERKITLPLLHVLEHASETERKTLLDRLRNIHNEPRNVDVLYDAVIAGGGLEEADRTMRTYCEQARRALDIFPESPARKALLDLCDYIAERDR